MIGENFSSRTVINRAYYVLFYALLSLFLKTGTNVQTSKHSGIISLFDREFVRTEKFDRRFSRILHNLFDDRQEGDYKEFSEISMEKARQHAIFAREFLDAVKAYTGVLT